MSIERNMERIADAIELIAQKLSRASELTGTTTVMPEVTIDVPVTAEGTPEPQPVAKKKRAKKVKEAPVIEAEPEPEPEPEVETSVTLNDLRELGRKAIKSGKTKEVKEWLREREAENLSKLDKKHFTAAYNFLNDMSNG